MLSPKPPARRKGWLAMAEATLLLGVKPQTPPGLKRIVADLTLDKQIPLILQNTWKPPFAAAIQHLCVHL